MCEDHTCKARDFQEVLVAVMVGCWWNTVWKELLKCFIGSQPSIFRFSQTWKLIEIDSRGMLNPNSVIYFVVHFFKKNWYVKACFFDWCGKAEKREKKKRSSVKGNYLSKYNILKWRNRFFPYVAWIKVVFLQKHFTVLTIKESGNHKFKFLKLSPRIFLY